MILSVTVLMYKGINRMQNIAVSKIKVVNNCSRQRGESDVADLMLSIRQNGLINPVNVAPNGNGFHLLSGHRRLAAYKKLKLKEIPAIVRHDLSKVQKQANNIAENVIRNAPSLQEEGHAYIELQKLGLSAGEIAANVGVKENRVVSCIDLWKSIPKGWRGRVITDGTRTKTKKGLVNYSTAHTIAQSRPRRAQAEQLMQAAADGASKAQIIAMVTNIKRKRVPVKKAIAAASNVKSIKVELILKRRAVARLERDTGSSVQSLFRKALKKQFKSLFV